MKLILQKDVKNLGKTGDQVTVKNGYARNYLLPNNFALVLNASRLKDVKHKKKVVEAKKKQAITDRQALLKKLAEVEVSFERESRSEGKLFGSVTAAEISRVLEKEHKLLIDKKDFVMEVLKEVGEHQVTVALDSENKTEFKVIIKKKITEKDNNEEAKTGFFSKRFFSKSDEKETLPSEDSLEDQKTEDPKELDSTDPKKEEK